MIPKKKEQILIQIYMYICDLYDSELKFCCQRYSNNSSPAFSDQEIITIYLFVSHCQNYFQVKAIHLFAKEYLLSWFPKLPSYQAFNYRLTRLSEAFKLLSTKLFETFKPTDCDSGTSLVDSMPIITCCGRNRVGKVAQEITTKGFCSTKNQYYYGLKLHALAFNRPQTIPFPESIFISSANECDLAVFKQTWGDVLVNRRVFGDKIYSDFQYFNHVKMSKQQIQMFTPVKNIKGFADDVKQFNRAFNDLYSRAVSKIRQPIESFFNWLNVKTTVQKASLVRSTKGLLVHVMGKISIAFIPLVFNP